MRAILILILLALLAIAAKAQHILILPQYRFTASVLDTSNAAEPVLMMYFMALDSSEVRVLGFMYPNGIYLGEVQMTSDGRTHSYPFLYEQNKPKKLKSKPNPKWKKAGTGG